jgi:sugar phosphate isomerase/epimerase
LVRKEIEATISWMRIAKEVEAPVSRIFGSPLPSGLVVHARGGKAGDDARKKLKERIAAALKEVTREAERLDLILALENHHGFPATGEEQVELIESMNSRCFRATVDVGNYMCADQTPEAGTALVAPYAAYVHVKDFDRVADQSVASGWKLVPRTVGKGDVNHAACLQILRDAGFDGFVAIEYEGDDDERLGVTRSVAFLKPLCDSAMSRNYR